MKYKIKNKNIKSTITNHLGLVRPSTWPQTAMDQSTRYPTFHPLPLLFLPSWRHQLGLTDYFQQTPLLVPHEGVM